MNRYRRMAAHYLLALAAPLALSACWASSWTNPIATFPTAALSASYSEIEGQILVLPLWKMYRDAKCETSLFFAPPVMLSSHELTDLVDHLENYEHKATMYLFVHPTWRWSPDLLGVYLVYPDGRIVWAGGRSLTAPANWDPFHSEGNAWTEFLNARMGKRWQQTLVTLLRAGSLHLSELATDIGRPIQLNYGLRVHKLTALTDPPCDHQTSASCCFQDLVTVKSDNPEETSSAIRYLEEVPTGDASGEEWSPVR